MFSIPILTSKSFAIDLGNSNTLLANDTGVLLAQPSYIAFDTLNHSVKAVGNAAYDMVEKHHENLHPIKPLRGGVIADFESASKMIHQMVAEVYPFKNWFSGFGKIVSGIPYSTTEVERRALRDALNQFGARKTYLLFEPLAAAMGMGLNIREPEGKMIIDIGGGITEIVVISLSGIAEFKSVKIAGDAFDRDIQDYVRKAYNMVIGLRTAEQIKLSVGAVCEDVGETLSPFRIKGKSIREGIPVSQLISHAEVVKALSKSFESIERNVIQVLETCPPELAADIYLNGIFVTGGGALLHGIKKRLEKTLQLPVHIDREPLLSVSKGASMALRDIKKFGSVLIE